MCWDLGHGWFLTKEPKVERIVSLSTRGILYDLKRFPVREGFGPRKNFFSFAVLRINRWMSLVHLHRVAVRMPNLPDLRNLGQESSRFSFRGKELSANVPFHRNTNSFHNLHHYNNSIITTTLNFSYNKRNNTCDIPTSIKAISCRSSSSG